MYAIRSYYVSLLEHYHNGVLSLETIVKRTSHAVAERYQIKERGYLREGSYNFV